jgi:hypothetical protein
MPDIPNMPNMPNICSDWVRISNCPESINFLAGQSLRLDMIDQQPPDLNIKFPNTDVVEGWIEKYWGTPWISGHVNEKCDIVWKREDDGSLTARFFSAWSPPLAFYKRILETYPKLQLEYEYAVWELKFAGYGFGSAIPRHFEYNTKEEMHALMHLRDWNVHIWHPRF